MGIFAREIRVFKLNSFSVLVSIVLTVISVWSTSVSALGMGAAIADSRIGQPLLVNIPIFNVSDPNNLSVILQRTDEAANSTPLQAKVEYLNFQLAIRVTSEKPTSEPYISFVLEVVDGTDISSKSFTVLLDLGAADRVSKLRAEAPPPVVTQASVSRPSLVVQPLSNTNSAIMGPYDWAKAGQVAEKFGPVLDGQSLWRVARRINQALDVSVDQMMWALYQSNRDQFATDSITSLKAGAVLRIPTAEQALRLSERQAKEQIQLASKANFSANSSGSVNPLASHIEKPAKIEPKFEKKPSATESSYSAEDSSVLEKSKVAESVEPSPNLSKVTESSPAFDLTGIGDTGRLNGTPGGIDPQSKQIIASLAEAVGNLSQEVIKKDKKISFLEEKVAALEKYAKVSSSDLIPVQANQAQPLVVKPQGQNNTNVEHVESIELWLPQLTFWHLLMVGLLIIVLMAFLFRARLRTLVKSLNLSNKNQEIEFDPTMFEHTESVQVFDSPPVVPEQDVTVTVELNPEPQSLNGLSQRSILDAIKSAVQTDDPLSPQTLMDLDGEFSYTEMLSEATYSITETELTFMERYERAMQQQDFGYASQLLNFARESELDIPLYHYHRLRLFEAMKDEDAFYDYYCEVEQMVPSYSTDLQTKISQLVLSMAQQ